MADLPYAAVRIRLEDDPLAAPAMPWALTAATVALCAAPQLERPFARLLSIRWIRGE